MRELLKDFFNIFFMPYRDRKLSFWMKLVITIIWTISIPIGLLYGAPKKFFYMLLAMILISIFTMANEMKKYNRLLEITMVFLEGILSIWIFQYAPIGYFSMFFLLLYSVGIIYILGIRSSFVFNLLLLVYLYYMLRGNGSVSLAELYNANQVLRFPYLYLCILSASYITAFSIQRYWYEKETRQSRLEARIREEKQKLAGMSMDVIKSMYGALGAKIPEIDKHCEQVGSLARKIAEDMQLNEETCQQAYYAGLLHEVGAIGLPDEILCKSNLTEDQYELYKTYVQRGYKIIKELQIVDTVADAVHYHRENYDGSGYLEGRRGEKIPVLSRILSISDYTDRHLRRGETKEEVLKKLTGKSGKAFDPDCVACVCRILEKN